MKGRDKRERERESLWLMLSYSARMLEEMKAQLNLELSPLQPCFLSFHLREQGGMGLCVWLFLWNEGCLYISSVKAINNYAEGKHSKVRLKRW